MQFKILERDTDPSKNKKIVYVTGHTADVAHINGYLFSIGTFLDGKVCSLAEGEKHESLESCRDSLKESDLFVVIVSRKFLTERNQAREMELQIAVEMQIPILPIAIEPGIEGLFNEICGYYHLLKGYEKESCMNEVKSYLYDKFDKTELENKIKSVFAGRMFLSYRKREREHALRLIEEVHKVKQNRDIAIWFDGELTYGEDYNDEIDERLNESDVFLLLVTPNILEDGNYVMEIEYPRAVELEKKILPVEIIPTDRNVLKAKFPNLPECIHMGKELDDALLKIRQEEGWITYPDDMERAYRLGEAYIRGIEVEINLNYGLEYLKVAADMEHGKAINRLVELYSSGETMPSDLSEGLKWMEKEAELAQREFDEDAGEMEAVHLVMSLRSLVGIYFEQSFSQPSKLMMAKNVAKRLEMLTEWLWKQNGYVIFANPGNAKLDLGKICTREGNYKEAVCYFEAAEEILGDLYEQDKQESVVLDYAMLRMEQGNVYFRIFENTGNSSYLQRALIYYEQSLPIWKKLVEDYTVLQNKHYIKNWADTCFNTGSSYAIWTMYIGDAQEALQKIEKAIPLLEKACRLTQNEEKVYAEYIFEMEMYGDILRKCEQEERAKMIYMQAYEKVCDLIGKNPYEKEYQEIKWELLNRLGAI